MNTLYIGDLTNRVTLDLAKPMLMKLGRDRVQRTDITPMEEQILQTLVENPEIKIIELAKLLEKTTQYVGRVLASLAAKNLVISKKEGREQNYVASIDAVIAYSTV